MSFAIPWLGYLAAATPLVLALVFTLDFTRRRRTLDNIGDAAMLRRMLATLSVRRRVIKAILFIIGVTGLMTAVARPQVEGESSWRQRGIDVAVVVDFSKSMLAEDVYPSRFRRTLIELDQLIEALEANRIAVVAAAGNAEYFPLTHDADSVRAFFAGITPLDMAPGSNLGQGVALARCILIPELSHEEECATVGRRAGGGAPLGADEALGRAAVAAPPADDRGRALVLFTDGGDTSAGLVDQVAATVAKGIQVYIVGVGTPAGELIPSHDANGRRIGWRKHPDADTFVTTRLERETLESAVAAAGELGELFVMGRKSFRRGELLEKLESLKKGNLDERVVTKPVEVYHWFLFPALLLLMIEACIRERRRIV